MIRSILSREDSVYKAFPDLAMASDGTLICTYRESLGHRWVPFSRVVVQLSRDEGLNWSKKQIIHVCADWEKDGGLNNPRLLSLGDNRLILICDWIPPREPEVSPDSEIFLWRSNDSGESWGKVEKTGIRGSICLSLEMTKSNKIILGCNDYQAYTSSDLGSSWDGPIQVASSSDLLLNEGSYVQLDNGLIVCYLREDGKGICAYKAISRNDGKSWEGPYATHLISCRGRPKAGLLRSGEVAITYGFDTAPRQLVLHIEPQSVAADPSCVEKTTKPNSYLAPIIRRFFIDHDRSIHPDCGYSGWVQLPSGDLYVVQYITDDAPMAHIRSYRISRNDWVLCPEGKLICTMPWETMQYHEIGLKASKNQYRKVYKKDV